MKITKMVGGPILDVPCKHCGCENTHHIDTDECEFGADGTGHYYEDYRCDSCGKHSRVYWDFKYAITKAQY